MSLQNSHQQLQAAMNWFHYDWNIGYSYKIYRVGVNVVGIGLKENIFILKRNDALGDL